jgi:hypothetical protein
MSLHHIAKHLKEQGRGSDDMLVHMTSGEFKAMQQLARAHGKSLTVNPSTGLPEAGMLKTILPMALGAAAAASGQWWAIPAAMALSAGGTYAMTGSLQQGLMAGLSAWSGGSLATGLAEAGAGTLATQGGEIAAEEFAKQQAASVAAEQATALTSQEVARKSAEEIAKSQIGNMGNLTADQITNMTSNLTNANAADVVRGAGAANAAMGSTTASQLGAGATNLGAIGTAISSNPGAALGAGTSLLAGSSDLFNRSSGSAPGTTGQKNPFGMKEIPRDADGKPIFYASVPEQPNPAYKPVYPDYVKNPYTSAASGGVMKMAEGGLAGQINLQGQFAFPNPQNQAQSANGYTPAGGQPWGGAQYSQQPQGGLGQLGTNQQRQTGASLPNQGSAPFATVVGNESPLIQAQTLPYNSMSVSNQAQQSGLSGMVDQQMGFNSPLNPQNMTTFATGGVAGYKGSTDYGSMIRSADEMQQGLETATRRKPLQYDIPDVGIYTPDAETRNMDSMAATLHYLGKTGAVLPKGLSGIKKTGALGAITHTPAAQQAQEAAAAQKAKEAIAKDSDSKDAKEGGLMRYAEGGETKDSHVYKPSYTDYKAMPYNIQSAMQAYNAQAPAGLPQTMPAVGSQGYAIDPLLMRGSPAYVANEAKVAAQKAEEERLAQLAGAAFQPNYAGGGLTGYAHGGHLGGYSDGGRLLRGPGDGVSDSIPATIGGKQPARLAEGEFVIPARIVSELGNGSTDAGAKRLYAMMDRIKAKRAKTKNIAANTKAYKYLPA